MPLGRQFRNTFHVDENGQEHFNTDLNTVPDKADLDSEQFNTPHTDTTGAPGVAYQGMFWSPHTGTGSRQDPMIPESDRRAAIQNALHIGKNESHYKAEKVAAKRIPELNQAVEDTAHNSGIPTHVFKNDVNVPVVVKKTLGKNTGGDYNSDGRHLVRVREGWPQRDIIGQEIKTEQSYNQGAAIHNPNFKDVLKDIPGWGGYGIHNYSKVRSPEGEEKHLTDYTDPTRDHKYKMHDPRDLPEGHTLNLWAGKGEDTDEYTTRTVKVPNGYTDSGRRKSAYVHFRHAKVPVGEPREVTRNVYGPDKPTISGSTLTHEIGHSIDPLVKDEGRARGGADTVNEAVADGYEDRFNKHQNHFEEALHPSPARAQEIKKEGYGLNHPQVSGSLVDKALYAAVRQHVSMGDNNYKDIESRGRLGRTGLGGRGNELLLGHLYSKHAHVRDILGHLNLGHIGEAAADNYRARITDAGKGPKHEQQEFNFE